MLADETGSHFLQVDGLSGNETRGGEVPCGSALAPPNGSICTVMHSGRFLRCFLAYEMIRR